MASTLSEIVLAEELASREAIERAAQSSEDQALPLIVPLVRDTSMDEMALVAALKKHLRVSTIDPKSLQIDPEALRELSREECTRLRLIPVSLAEYGEGPRTLRIAVADPSDRMAILEVEYLTHCQVEVGLMTLSAVEELIESSYRHRVTEVMERRNLAQRAKRGRALSRHRNSDDELRVQALLELCLEKQLFTKDEFRKKCAALLKSEE